jgi:C4-dicarboxylate-specific signal transduction histidine kinase
MRSFYRKSPPKRELVEVNQIIDEILALVKSQATGQSVNIRTELTIDFPKTIADRVQLQQVFMNLMLNAIEAIQDSGGELTVKSQLQDGQLQFSVSDTGVGLPTEQAMRSFLRSLLPSRKAVGWAWPSAARLWGRTGAVVGHSQPGTRYRPLFHLTDRG